MSESVALSKAAVVLLCIGLALHWPALTRRIPRWVWGLAGAGALLPLLDLGIAFALAEDQIGMLTRPHYFAGPLPCLGLSLLIGLALAVWSGPRIAGVAVGALLAGLGLSTVLGLASVNGVPLLAPFQANRFGWGVLPTDNLPLLAVLAMGVALMEAMPHLGNRLRWAPVGFAAAYVAALVVGYAWALSTAPDRTSAVANRSIEVDGWLPYRWRVVDQMADAYFVTTRTVGGDDPAEPRSVPRWNDEGLLLQHLEDPIVYRLYFRSFTHPVAELKSLSSQTTLTVQELSERLTGVSGKELVFNSDHDGKNRLYRLERFE